jgi:pyruvate,orthophosphate dikinase
MQGIGKKISLPYFKLVHSDQCCNYGHEVGFPFPQRPIDQLQKAIEAIFNSWESSRCIEYRKIHKIRNLLGTAVTIQTMVFGNMGLTAGSGVAFTRNPSTGGNGLYGEFLFNAQGEDIVSGRYMPQGLGKLGKFLPNIHRQLNIIGKRLEIEFKDMQEFEFTIQEGNLFILQSRNGKKTPWAGLQIGVDMVNEGLISKETALDRFESYDLLSIKRAKIVSSCSPTSEAVCLGVSACPGIAMGEITLDSENAKEKSSLGRSIILVRDDISTTGLVGMAVCQGILTRTGGKTSHAAVVARQMNKVCIVGCQALIINMENRTCSIGNKVLNGGDYVSLDGNTGNVYVGEVEYETEYPEKILAEVQKWKNRHLERAEEPSAP